MRGKEYMNRARQRLNELYGKNVTFRINNRFKLEYALLCDSDDILWMGFYHELTKKCKGADVYLEVMDDSIRTSFIAWLLCENRFNPLPAHYYCPVCKHVEFVDEYRCGIDLPDKKCVCGGEFLKEGFCMDMMYGCTTGDKNTVYVSKGGTDIVRNCFNEFFKSDKVIKEQKVTTEDDELVLNRFILLSEENAHRISTDEVTIDTVEYYDVVGEVPILNVIENHEKQLHYSDIKQIKNNSKYFKAFWDSSIEKDMFSEGAQKLRDKTQVSFCDLIGLKGLQLGYGTWTENAEDLLGKGIAFDDLITNREDVYTYLNKQFTKKCRENTSSLAFEIMNNLRKGIYEENGMPNEIEELLLACDIPSWYVESMKKIKYLASKKWILNTLQKEFITII